MTLLEQIFTWPVWAQLILSVVVVTSLTSLTGVFFRSFARDFMNTLAILVRGWPPAHVESDEDEEDDMDDMVAGDDKK